MKITTDIDGLERVAPDDMDITPITAALEPRRWTRNIALLRSAVRSDFLIIHFSLPEVIFFSFLLFLAPSRRCKIVTLDFFAGDIRPALRPLARWSLRRVSRFLVYFKDSSPFQTLFGIPGATFRYIPFKVNAIETIRGTPCRDDGYIFSGGRSRRDFATLFAAVADLGYPVKVLTGREPELLPHGSSLQALTAPPNVEILHNDSSSEYFVNLLAGARLVVIPLVPHTRTQAGIGVYLQAMAARKCVIISSGLGVSDVLTEGQAMIVPAGDAAALRAAIAEIWENCELRNRYAETGYRYAATLGGEDELRRSVLGSLS